ncbi:hypothetical protein QR680_017234 [Steinernema hermaphroditum]|uniref:1-phosphatidylinositol-3-phosphate 5-kinase n=1 Tax=Steinernema hermaphroditum TaxID=289476 RepID=A0AA39HDU8_9BILA|nr:hypothetical protein QR680_017234 [Steinernema hermaphroditum]
MSGRPDSLTSFPRLPVEVIEEQELDAQSQGVLSSFFGRIFRGSAPSSVDDLSETARTSTSESSPSARASPALEPLHRTDSKSSADAGGGDTPRSFRKLSLESLSAAEQKKFSSRLTSIFRSSNRAKLEDYNQSAFKRYWMPDSTGKECYECQEKFTAFRRRHHCRLCGQIFCSKCSSAQVPGALLGYMGDLRLCSYCARIVESYLSAQKDDAEHAFRRDDDAGDSRTSLAKSFSHEGTPADSEREGARGISTVSAGSLMWSGDDPLNHRRASVVEPSVSSDLLSVGSASFNSHPTMLCVQQLALQNREFTHASSDVVLGAPSSHRNSDEFEFEPDWVKRIEWGQAFAHMDGFKPSDTFPYELAPSAPISNVPSTSDLTQSGIQFEVLLPEGPDSLPKPEVVTDDTQNLFEQRLDRLLSVLFEREQLDPEVWRPVLWSLSRQIAKTVRVDVARHNDSMNILDYVHIKKFLVEEQTPSTRVVHGVACSKAIAHGQMPAVVENASVLTLAGSIEYERVGGKLSTLLPIINQEKDYLAKQIDRMMSRRPSVVVVENTVAYLAVEMLLAEGVCLVSNIRQKVVKRIARVTGADVLPSLDAQLLQQRIGFAPVFRQERVRLKNGARKTILIFDDCNKELGCSVLLFANSMRELRAAKRIMKFMVAQWYSTRLEIAFLEMFDTKLVVQARHSDCVACQLNRDDMEQFEEEGSFGAALARTELVNSPFVRVGAPFLATSRGQKCNLRQYFKQQNLYRYARPEEFVALREQLERAERENDEVEARVQVQKAGIDANMRHPFLADQKVVAVEEDAVAQFRALDGLVFRSRHEEKTSRFGRPSYEWGSGQSPASSRAFLGEPTALKDDALSPLEHQKIAVLFGSYSAKSNNAPFFCIKPWVFRMPFYCHQDKCQDMCLGVFLHKFCFDETYRCSSCDLSMLEHQRKIVYRRVRIEITMQSFVQQASEEFGGHEGAASAFSQQVGLVSWRYCPSCKSSSQVVPLSAEVWHLSFAKFVDYLANGVYSTSKIPAATRSGRCTHCSFHEQQHFFALGNFVTIFRCIVEPKMISRQAIVVNKDEMVRMGCAIFDQMQLYLERFESHPEAPKHIALHSLLSSLLAETRQTFEDRLGKFDPTNALSATTTIRSNDVVYINATEAISWCRHIVFRLLEKWNEQSVCLAAAIKSLKKSASSAAIDTPAVNGSTLESTTAALAGLAPDPEIPVLESPFAADLHLSLPWRPNGVPVVVRDLKDAKGNTQPDFGSIIAYALASPKHEEQKRKLRQACGEDSVPLNLKVSASVGHLGREANGGASAESANLGAHQHIEVDFEDASARYYVKAYYAEQFQMLRKVLFTEGEDQFIRSLSQSLNWNPEGGKSGASFFKTRDERFVFKQMSRFEIQSFVKFAPNYFDYIYTAVSEKKLTMLCKVYGVYRVAYTKKQTNQETKMDVLVMEYLFYRRKIKQTWDLKGSLRNRWAPTAKNGTPVLLDENLVKDFWNNQLYVHPHSKAALNQAISNDSHFLSSQHVMDYSLLAGIDEENDEVILGIVDYMRTYTLDKKLESWVKIVAIPGGQLPTVLSPEMYCTRFSDAIDTYFPIAPDQWTGIGLGMNY